MQQGPRNAEATALAVLHVALVTAANDLRGSVWRLPVLRFAKVMERAERAERNAATR